MARLLHEVASSQCVWSSQQALFMCNIFHWGSVLRDMPSVPFIFEEFAQQLPNALFGKAPRVREMAPMDVCQLATSDSLSSEVMRSVVEHLASEVRDLLGLEIGLDEPLMAAGLDSLGVVQLRNAITERFGVEVPPTVALDFPTILALAGFVAQKLAVAPEMAPVDIRQLAAGVATSDSLSSVDERDIVEHLASEVRDLLGLEIGLDEPLMAAGLDSLGVVQLRNAITERFGVEVPPTVALDFPTISALAGFVAQTIAPLSKRSDSPPLNFPSNLSRDQSTCPDNHGFGMTEIAGLSCTYPGTAAIGGVSEFWHAAIVGADLPTVVPHNRWSIERHYSPDVAVNKMYVRFAAFLPGVDTFDAALFRLSHVEASLMDPQCRVLLEHTHLSLADASSRSRQPMPLDSGVYVGVMQMEFLQYCSNAGLAVGPNLITGNGMDFLVGRISYTFGLKGPCISTNTACSSSLVATHLAHTGLLEGEAAAAAACGVLMVLLPEAMSGICLLQALSPAGRCKTFEASGDGYGRGEGCVVATMQPAGSSSSGEALALVRSTMVNQDGRSSSLTAPNGPSQTELVTTALSRAGISARAISCVAMHGTGTALGDPIELGALGRALSCQGTGAMHQVAVASNKSCYGHTEGAAGLTGALMALQTLHNQACPPILGLRNINPYVESAFEDWRQMHCLVASAPRVAMPLVTVPQFAGTSSFGMSGVNAHAVMESSPDICDRVWSSSTSMLQRQRHWALVPAFHLSGTAQQFGPRCSFVVALSQPALSFLLDHQVGGQALLPGTAMFDTVANLKLEMHASEIPAPGTVKLCVRAVGLNFRDVLNVLGMYPGDPGPPGADFAGVVAAAGPGVHTMAAGEAVFA
ncbi:Polyketide synthase [Micractinium conductrix]|uniref:Polyketide synthase n=1 Tax=Micractinium conductrix TaxID=554055 RepID=A0A2P6VL09_9CHLO|nr:Polyketide synthase [Micractinium conductrix]|eukprot:PSC74792.1 Polyketide synthase [Micractinium conductrix]